MRLAESSVVCGGYFLTAPVRRPEYTSPSLLPATIVSLSDCICDFVPDDWAVDWGAIRREDRLASASRFGLSADGLDQVAAWTTRELGEGRFGWPSVFFSLASARGFAARFLGSREGLAVYGIALQESELQNFLSCAEPPRHQGPTGVYMALSSGRRPAPGGEELGWEILGYEDGWFHSWLCNGLEVEAAEELNVRPNKIGFISDPDDAARVAEYCGREEVGAEPALWAAWRVSRYEVEGLESAA